MTQKEIDRARATLPRRFEYKDWTEEQKCIDNELSCRDMVNSCLVYHGENFGWKCFWEEDEWRWGDKSYAAPFVRALGRARVEEIFKEQIEDFRRATVHTSVYTDSDGITYNSIEWADERGE